MEQSENQSKAELTPDAVRRIARLSRLTLDEARVETLRRELGAVLGYVGRLAVMDGDDARDGGGHESLAGDTPLRPDEPGETLDLDVVMRMAPQAQPPWFSVPRVLGDGGGA